VQIWVGLQHADRESPASSLSLRPFPLYCTGYHIVSRKHPLALCTAFHVVITLSFNFMLASIIMFRVDFGQGEGDKIDVLDVYELSPRSSSIACQTSWGRGQRAVVM